MAQAFLPVIPGPQRQAAGVSLSSDFQEECGRRGWEGCPVWSQEAFRQGD